MRGIILAGGKATRLWPSTKVISKQILPIYDRPMIYYPLATLMELGIRDILLISSPEQLPFLQQILEGIESLGVRVCFAPQTKPRGIADAFMIGEDFIAGESSCLILGDNFFYDPEKTGVFQGAQSDFSGAQIWGYQVPDPERFGVVEFSSAGEVLDIVEKPQNPRSSYAVTGLYFYDEAVVSYARDLKPSPRGELEITDINRRYLAEKKLQLKLLPQESYWLDVGTYDSLLFASQYVKEQEQREKAKICCIEEIALRQGWSTQKEIEHYITQYQCCPYGEGVLNMMASKTL